MGTCLMYRIILRKPAKKFIDRLPVNEKKRVVAAIEKLPEGEIDMGDIYARKMYDDDHYLRIRATFNGLIYLSKQDIIGNTVIDCYIPANETLDKKEISFVSEPMPFREAGKLVRKILTYMISPYYRASWSKKERQSLMDVKCTGKQWGLICHEYERYCAKPKYLSMLDANDLIELKKDIAEITAREMLLEEEEAGSCRPDLLDTYMTNGDNKKKFEDVIKRLKNREAEDNALIADTSNAKALYFEYEPRGMHLKIGMTDRQDAYIRSLITGMYKNRIFLDGNFKYNVADWTKGTAGALIGLLKAITENLHAPADDSFAVVVNASKARHDICDTENIRHSRNGKRYILCEYTVEKIE